MTRDEYLYNHDAHEGAEEEIRDPRCPICGSDECEVYAVRDGEIVGCNHCLCHVLSGEISWLDEVGCPECGAENTEGIYLRHENGKVIEVVGCENCLKAIPYYEVRREDYDGFD